MFVGCVVPETSDCPADEAGVVKKDAENRDGVVADPATEENRGGAAVVENNEAAEGTLG